MGQLDCLLCFAQWQHICTNEEHVIVYEKDVNDWV